jgi:2-hydroxychromene-2-carboxylate isomerase
MTTVDFFFDFSCPWSYLALVRLRDVADRNAAKIRFKPVSAHELLATENPGLQASRLAENPAKAVWQQDDLEHWARFWGLTIKLHPNWPFEATTPAMAMLAACDVDKGIDFALLAFAEHFGSGSDINDPAVLGRIATAAGMDSSATGQADNDSLRARVEQNTQELIRRGGFGTPTIFIRDQLFFGNDRIPLVEWMLGPISDDEFVMPGQHGKV